ncbi:hypothetical protein Sm713_27590 [Streptomyces sp. TS71-3]|nr:hypothetical protein Sm713_27590 [Streptomyces sp. TS71-3]
MSDGRSVPVNGIAVGESTARPEPADPGTDSGSPAPAAADSPFSSSAQELLIPASLVAEVVMLPEGTCVACRRRRKFSAGTRPRSLWERRTAPDLPEQAPHRLSQLNEE